MGSSNHNVDEAIEDESNQKHAEIMSTRKHDNDNDDLSVSSDSSCKINDNTLLTNDAEVNVSKKNHPQTQLS